MKMLLVTMFVALLMVGCGEEQNPEDSNDKENNASALAPFADEWAEWEANPKPYGGLEVLAKIKAAKESGATKLDLSDNQISDVSPLKELTNLGKLDLRYNKITDVSPLAGLTNLEVLGLYRNKISDLSPLKGLTNLKALWLGGNKISDLSPLAGLTNLEALVLDDNQISDDQKSMLKKALPNCKIHYSIETSEEVPF